MEAKVLILEDANWYSKILLAPLSMTLAEIPLMQQNDN